MLWVKKAKELAAKAKASSNVNVEIFSPSMAALVAAVMNGGPDALNGAALPEGVESIEVVDADEGWGQLLEGPLPPLTAKALSKMEKAAEAYAGTLQPPADLKALSKYPVHILNAGPLSEQQHLGISPSMGSPISMSAADGCVGVTVSGTSNAATHFTDMEMQWMEGWFAHMFGLTDKLPNNHPWKYMKPPYPMHSISHGGL
jgi:hypothetical protein